ncbi:MAG: sugar phosphate isomerase/epimerase family protein [Christensenellaceae bacterium]|jgi:myo-inositol catabolism protein IolH
MKITFDTSAFWGTDIPFEEQYARVAEAGYKYISPYNEKFPGQHKRPKATDAEVMWHKKAIKDAGLEIASIITGYRIADPDEFMRQCAIEHWFRMMDIAEMMEVKNFNSEIGGDITQPELCEEKFMKSLDVIVPELEKRGMRMDFQAHPFDFYESSDDTVDIIRSYDSKALGYLYSIPHAFHYDGGKGDVEAQLEYAKPVLKHVIVADTYDYTKTFRYNINPPTVFARVHAHIGNIGEGDVNLEGIWKKLREMNFGEQEDTIATFNPLGFPELAVRDGRHTREVLMKELGGE